MSFVILNDEIVHYEIMGRGKPLIFIHGWIGSWRYWIPTMQVVSISFRTYAIDLWGFGDTAKIPYLYPLDQQVHLLGQFLNKFDIDRIALIGHGLGAIVSILFASLNRNRVDRIMAIGLPNLKFRHNSRLLNSKPSELIEWLLGRTNDSNLVRMELLKTDQQAIQFSLNSLNELAIESIKEKLDTPTLIVHGAEDPILEGRSQQDISANLPHHIHPIALEGSGHFPMLDDPSKFNRLVIDFLTLTSEISPHQLQLKEKWSRRVR